MAYAAETSVPFDRSIAETLTLLRKAGVTHLAQRERPGFLSVEFMLADRLIRLELPVPALEDMPELGSRRQRLTEAQRRGAHEQRVRQRGRALMLVVKAKLESIESGIETVEQAFLANIVLADNTLLHQRVRPAIAQQYETGQMSPLLLEGPSQ